MTEGPIETRTRAGALFVGTTVRYRWRGGAGLATVTEATDDRVAFSGPDCDGRFTPDQVDRLFADDRLEIVMDDARPAARRRNP